jgi:DNA-binding response OmpR family regulator
MVENRVLLVVDDDQDLLTLMTLILEPAGYSVETASNGQEALNRIAMRMPDLILLDMLMPVMSGWDFAVHFRRLYGFRVPIIVITAAESARRRARDIGADGYISKPFDIDHMLAVIHDHLRPADSYPSSA